MSKSLSRYLTKRPILQNGRGYLLVLLQTDNVPGSSPKKSAASFSLYSVSLILLNAHLLHNGLSSSVYTGESQLKQIKLLILNDKIECVICVLFF